MSTVSPEMPGRGRSRRRRPCPVLGERERWVAGSVLGIAEKTRRGTSKVLVVQY